AQVMQTRRYVDHQRLEHIGVGQRLVQGLLEINRLDLVEVLQDEVLVLEQLTQLDGKALGIEQVTDAQAASCHLVFVGRSDTTPGSTDLALGTCRFARLVQRHVIRQDQRTGRADPQTLADRHALFFQLGDLAHQRIGCDHHAVADQALDVFTQDSGRNQVQYGLFTVNNQRVTSVVAALKTNHGSGLVSQQIDDLALALITPLGAQDHDILTHKPMPSSAKQTGHNNR